MCAIKRIQIFNFSKRSSCYEIYYFGNLFVYFCLRIKSDNKVEAAVEASGFTKAQMEGKAPIVEPYHRKKIPLVYNKKNSDL
jgi:hypothetical protein